MFKLKKNKEIKDYMNPIYISFTCQSFQITICHWNSLVFNMIVYFYSLNTAYTINFILFHSVFRNIFVRRNDVLPTIFLKAYYFNLELHI